jgi:hypothetical protein
LRKKTNLYGSSISKEGRAASTTAVEVFSSAESMLSSIDPSFTSPKSISSTEPAHVAPNEQRFHSNNFACVLTRPMQNRSEVLSKVEFIVASITE